MYEELIKALRERAAWINFPNHGEEYPVLEAKLMYDAADAIEELTAFRNTLEDGRLYIMRDGVLYVSSNYKLPDGAKTATLPTIVDFHKEPPKEET